MNSLEVDLEGYRFVFCFVLSFKVSQILGRYCTKSSRVPQLAIPHLHEAVLRELVPGKTTIIPVFTGSTRAKQQQHSRGINNQKSPASHCHTGWPVHFVQIIKSITRPRPLSRNCSHPNFKNSFYTRQLSFQ